MYMYILKDIQLSIGLESFFNWFIFDLKKKKEETIHNMVDVDYYRLLQIKRKEISAIENNNIEQILLEFFSLSFFFFVCLCVQSLFLNGLLLFESLFVHIFFFCRDSLFSRWMFSIKKISMTTKFKQNTKQKYRIAIEKSITAKLKWIFCWVIGGLPPVCLWCPFFVCWQMNGNGDLFDNRHLNMHWNMFHNWNMLVDRNRLDVMMMNVVCMNIVWNMNDNVLTAKGFQWQNREEKKKTK